MIKNLIDV